MKPFLKSTVKYSLIVLGPLMALAGLITGMCQSTEKEEGKKEALLNKYRLTQEFKDEVDSRADYYEQGYQQGIITKDEYDEKMDYFLTDDFVQELIEASEDSEYKTELAQIQTKLDEENTVRTFSFIGIATGALMTIVGSTIKDESEPEKE